MKIKLIFAAAILAMASTSNAATYLLNNVISGGPSDVLMETYEGFLLNGGIVAIGDFTGGAPSSDLGQINTTISNFNLRGSLLCGSYSADLGGSYAGYYQGTLITGSTILTGNPLIGQGVYLFAGNAATLALSTQWAIVKVGTYVAEDPAFPVQYTANANSALTSSNIVIGKVDSVGSALGGTNQSLQLAAVPEPSAALLGALGVLGLLRRRRN